MNLKRLFPALLGCALLQPALAAGAIDPALFGTWKLQWERDDYFWVVREDGVYRLHGPGGPRQYGHLEATGGNWSMKSLFPTVNGTYTLDDADTWTVTGPLGPGIWNRVWSPASRQPNQPAGTGIGEDAGAKGLQSGGLTLHILKGGVEARIDLGLTPAPTLEDLPYLVALGRAADPRLGATGHSLKDLLDLLSGR